MYKNNDREVENRINKEIDSVNMAYKIEDREGNRFVFGGIENNIAWYRASGGAKHIDDLQGYKVIEKYCKLV